MNTTYLEAIRFCQRRNKNTNTKFNCQIMSHCYTSIRFLWPMQKWVTVSKRIQPSLTLEHLECVAWTFAIIRMWPNVFFLKRKPQRKRRTAKNRTQKISNIFSDISAFLFGFCICVFFIHFFAFQFFSSCFVVRATVFLSFVFKFLLFIAANLNECIYTCWLLKWLLLFVLFH